MPDTTAIIRPSAILAAERAAEIVRELEKRDVSAGGVWSASSGLWQRYDHAWDGPGGTHGTAKLVGSIGVVYGTPSKYDITIFRVTVTDHGIKQGWTVESVTDDALGFVGLTLATCPRASLPGVQRDPFYKGGGSGTDAPAM